MTLIIRVFTLNCGNGTPGRTTCSQLIDELLESDTQLMILHCQENHFRATERMLRKAIGNRDIKLCSSQPMVTHTTFQTQFHNQTGLITFYVYKAALHLEIDSEHSRCIRRTMNRTESGYNKGGFLQVLFVGTGDELYRIISINGHLDSVDGIAKQHDWDNLNKMLWPVCDSWTDLAEWAPDMLVAGWDANTRNILHDLPGGHMSRNQWQDSNLDEIRIMLDHPLGNYRESDISTKSPKKDLEELFTPDSKRPNRALGGMLDVVSYQSMDDILFDPSNQTRVHSAMAVIAPEKHCFRDHVVIGSHPIIISTQNPVERVRNFIAAGLSGRHPQMAHQLLIDEPNEELLLFIYHKYFTFDTPNVKTKTQKGFFSALQESPQDGMKDVPGEREGSPGVLRRVP